MRECDYDVCLADWSASHLLRNVQVWAGFFWRVCACDVLRVV